MVPRGVAAAFGRRAGRGHGPRGRRPLPGLDLALPPRDPPRPMVELLERGRDVVPFALATQARAAPRVLATARAASGLARVDASILAGCRFSGVVCPQRIGGDRPPRARASWIRARPSRIMWTIWRSA
eukprot:4600832-Lingulodinium_polyedra.AAC.1